ncbi:hypothetical protein MSWHS_2995 [Methanosarcina sp. WWM596]|nr:hypothetical protein MSWHS_2995 [Methanosarcina sp. WWM596]AKB22371.1 hypothetical protein MSWH1_2100 [Methanosarcina sp. WH1]
MDLFLVLTYAFSNEIVHKRVVRKQAHSKAGSFKSRLIQKQAHLKAGSFKSRLAQIKGCSKKEFSKHLNCTPGPGLWCGRCVDMVVW